MTKPLDKKLKCCYEDDDYPDCDPSCWEIDADWIDWDAEDEMVFGTEV